MLTRLKGLAAAIIAGGFFVSAPAYAQTDLDDLTEDQQSEMYCVYDWIDLFDEAETIADAYLSGQTSGAKFDEASEILDENVADCADEFEWDDKKQEIAAALGLYGSVSDVLTDRLLKRGLTDGHIEKVFEVIKAMSDDDFDGFYDGAWRRDDGGLKNRTVAALAAAGLPSDAAILNDAMEMMEANIVGVVTTQDWIDYAIDG